MVKGFRYKLYSTATEADQLKKEEKVKFPLSCPTTLGRWVSTRMLKIPQKHGLVFLNIYIDMKVSGQRRGSPDLLQELTSLDVRRLVKVNDIQEKISDFFFFFFVATFVWPPTPSCHSLRQRMSWMLPTDLRESSPLPRPFSTLNILKTMTRRCPTQRGWWMLTRRSSGQTAAKEDRCWSPTARKELISREVLWFLWRICKLYEVPLSMMERWQKLHFMSDHAQETLESPNQMNFQHWVNPIWNILKIPQISVDQLVLGPQS